MRTRHGLWVVGGALSLSLLAAFAAPASATLATTPLVLPGAGSSDDLVCASSMLAADVDGLGGDELVVSCPRDRPRDGRSTPMFVYRAQGKPRRMELVERFESPAGTVVCPSIATGDVNGDRLADLVLGCYGDDPTSNGAWVYERRSGGAAFQPPRRLPLPVLSADPAPTYCASVSVADLDGNGHDDVVASCEGDELVWSAGASEVNTGTFVTWQRASSNTGFDPPQRVGPGSGLGGAFCGNVKTGDVDGNGVPDLVAACSATATEPSRFVVVLRHADGAPAGHLKVANQAPFWCRHDLVVQDLLGDSAAEIAFACSSTDRAFGVVARYLPAGGFGFSWLGSTGRWTVSMPWGSARCETMQIADLRGFGRFARTVALGCPAMPYAGGALVHEARPGARAALPVDVVRGPRSDQPCGMELASGDFDGDGRDDLALACGTLPGEGIAYEDTARSAIVAFGAAAMSGSPREDLLVGTARADRLAGGAAMDVVRGRGGNDVLDGGAGEDVISGGPGDDVIQAADGSRDRVDCGPGRDRAVVDARDVVRGCETVVRRG